VDRLHDFAVSLPVAVYQFFRDDNFNIPPDGLNSAITENSLRTRVPQTNYSFAVGKDDRVRGAVHNLSAKPFMAVVAHFRISTLISLAFKTSLPGCHLPQGRSKHESRRTARQVPASQKAPQVLCRKFRKLNISRLCQVGELSPAISRLRQ